MSEIKAFSQEEKTKMTITLNEDGSIDYISDDFMISVPKVNPIQLPTEEEIIRKIVQDKEYFVTSEHRFNLHPMVVWKCIAMFSKIPNEYQTGYYEQFQSPTKYSALYSMDDLHYKFYRYFNDGDTYVNGESCIELGKRFVNQFAPKVLEGPRYVGWEHYKDEDIYASICYEILLYNKIKELVEKYNIFKDNYISMYGNSYAKYYILEDKDPIPLEPFCNHYTRVKAWDTEKVQVIDMTVLEVVETFLSGIYISGITVNSNQDNLIFDTDTVASFFTKDVQYQK